MEPNKESETGVRSSNIDLENGQQKKPLKPKTISTILASSSLQGISKISKTDSTLIKAFWTVLVFGAYIFMGFHGYLLFNAFFEYKTQTNINVLYGQLEFPAVTICNVNPMRISKAYIGSQELRDFIAELDPEEVGRRIDRFMYRLMNEDKEGKNDTNVGTNNRAPRKTNKGTGFKKPFRRGQRNQNWSWKRNSTNKNGGKTSEDEAVASEYYISNRKFQELLGSHSWEDRAKMGHQISDMLIQCSFAGKQCNAGDFTRSQSQGFGNCYTLENKKFISIESGPAEGLQLQLFLETDEYVPGITNSKGLQVVIHDQGTVPFPEDKGVAVSASAETLIGLHRVDHHRLGYPYANCSTNEAFIKQYGIKYSLTTCQKICLHKWTQKKCGCYDPLHQEVDEIVTEPYNLKPCLTTEEIKCAISKTENFEKNKDKCECYRPCRETQFKKSTTSRMWPRPAFAEVLSRMACTDNTSACSNLWAKGRREVREQFAKLVIYYVDLNYQVLTETPNYPLTRFISDIGGSLSLWIGLSLLSFIETLNLITSVLIHAVVRKVVVEEDSPSPRIENSMTQSRAGSPPSNTHSVNMHGFTPEDLKSKSAVSIDENGKVQSWNTSPKEEGKRSPHAQKEISIEIA